MSNVSCETVIIFRRSGVRQRNVAQIQSRFLHRSFRFCSLPFLPSVVLLPHDELKKTRATKVEFNFIFVSPRESGNSAFQW